MDLDFADKKMKKGIIGVSGEYFVAAELSQRGYVATLTLKNTPKIDILVTNLESGKYANIQVKTMASTNKTGWRLGKKDEEISKIKNHYYVLVRLKELEEKPDYYIVPQKEVAKFIQNDHKGFLDRGGKDNDIRVIKPVYEFCKKYKDSWEILGL
jgi:hypothetical protein